MAVQEQTPYKEYTANGSTTSFALGFICDSKNDLIVLVDGVAPPVATWSLIGANAVFTTAPASGKKIVLQRNTAMSRTANYQSNNNSFRPETINKDIDRVWWKLQELGVRDWLLDLKIQKFRDDVNLTAMEETLEQAQSLRDDTAAFAVEVEGNVVQSQTLLVNTTAKANAAASSATSANSSKDLAKQYADNIDASLTAIAGGHKAYATLAAALANTSTFPQNSIVEITNDGANNGTYQWDGTTLTKSAYDPKTQAVTEAKTYADANKLDLSSITYAYTDGNIVGNKTKTVEGYGLNSARNYATGTTYTSKIIPVRAGYDLYVLNDKANYSASAGNGYAFFDDDPSVNQSAIRIADNRVAAVDTETSLAYERVTVPDGAKYLVINSRFTTVINWAIHRGVFSSSYEPGTEVLFSVNGATIKEQLKPSLINTLEQGNKTLGDLYQPSGVLYNQYLNVRHTLVAGAGGMDWRAFRFKVSEGSSYYLKIIGAQTFPFKVIYSKSFDGVSENTTYAGAATLTLTNQENIYKLTVPTGLGIVAVFMNIKVDSGSYTLNIADTLSVQEGHFDIADIGKSGSGISSINGNAIVDSYARAKLDEQGSVESKSRLSGKKVFALGDSITEGTQGGYVKFLEAAFDTAINNYGASGGRASRVADQVTSGEGLPKRNTATAGTVWPVMDFTDLACVTLMIGTNDSDSSTFGTIEGLPTTNIGDHATPAEYWALFPNDYLSNIALVIEYIKLKAPKCEIHLITPPYRFNEAAGTDRITKLIPSLEAVAKYYGIHLIYATYESGISYKFMDGSLDFYSYDGIHFNEVGNEVFGKFVAQKVLSFG